MRRKVGDLTRIEGQLLGVAQELFVGGEREFHGRYLSQRLEAAQGRKQPVAFGSLYRALDRLESMGYLESYLEDPAKAEAEKRPRRRFYRLTGTGQRAEVAEEPRVPSSGVPGLRLAH